MKNKKLFIIPFLILLLLVAWNASALAAGDQSNTPGIPGQKPLSFVSATYNGGTNAQNAVNVPLNPKFTLLFDKNIVNSLVWGNNSQCFIMVSGNNENIPIKVTKIDDTIDFSQRQNVFIQPVNSLRPGTSYRILVSPKLLAKNQYSTLGGTTNGQGITISFKTEGQAVQPSAPANNQNNAPTTGNQSTSAKSPSISTNSASNVSDASKDSASSSANNQGTQVVTDTGKKETKKQPGKAVNKASIANTLNNADDEAGANNNWIVYVGIVLLAAWLVIEVYLKKKKRKSSQ